MNKESQGVGLEAHPYLSKNITGIHYVLVGSQEDTICVQSTFQKLSVDGGLSF